MKTTVEIAEPLLAAAKRLAAERGTTLRDLVETGLALVVEQHERERDFTLRDATFTGDGLQAAFRDAGWDEIRDAAYRGRGG